MTVSPGHEIAMALRDAYWAMHREADACLAPLGVTANQFVLLTLLARQEAETQQELVARASSDPNTIRAMLIALERKGLVQRGSHPSDRRARSVALTSKGRQAWQKLWLAGEDCRARLLAAVQPHQTGTLLNLLHRVTSQMSGSLPAEAEVPSAAPVSHAQHQPRSRSRLTASS